MNNSENPRFTERICLELGRSHQLPYNVIIIKGSLGGETSVLRTFRMSGKELVKERVSKERVRQGKS
jgi:hypothetical protein